MKNPNLTDAARAFIHSAGFAEGIVPMEDTRMDVRRALECLPADESRKMKRKFRKLWRKQAERLKANPRESLSNLMTPNQAPSRLQKQARKDAVWTTIQKARVEPMLEQFKNIPVTPTIPEKKD